MKRRKIVAVATIVVLAAVLAWLLLSRSHAETDGLVLDWHSAGQSLEVQGVVLDSKHAPIVGQHVNVVDDSGGQSATTDEQGHFSVEVGETEVKGIELPDIGSISWGTVGLGGLNVSGKGLEFVIIAKKLPTATGKSHEGLKQVTTQPVTQPSVGSRNSKNAYVFKGQVVEILLRDKFEGVVIPVGIWWNANYVIVVDKVLPIAGNLPAHKGQKMAFAIHSPSKLFADTAEQTIGNWYEFTASAEEGRSVFLEARRIVKVE